ncbi:hypothetical protein CCP3SC5AM1_1110005 [Gammaproteobacteria bacterium]
MNTLRSKPVPGRQSFLNEQQKKFLHFSYVCLSHWILNLEPFYGQLKS